MLKDGQHQHGHQITTLEVENDGLILVALHFRTGCSVLGKMLRPEDSVPVELVLEDADPNLATVVCGACKQKLGKCKVKQQNVQIGRKTSVQPEAE
jgi:hypothetical protein